MDKLLAILAATTLVTGGCSRTPTLAAQIQNVGGETALRRECQRLLDEHEQTKKELWMPQDLALSPTIAALQPQVVEVSRYDDMPFVYIQLSGGFGHRGLMVVLTNTSPGFMPHKSNWKVTKLSDEIFEYRE